MKLTLLATGLVLLATQVVTYTAAAAPRLDRDVQAFLSNHSEGIMPVLLTYKRNISIPNRPYQARYHAEIERALMQSTLQQERAIFQGELAPFAAKRRSYWIITGTAVELGKPQLRSLLSHQNIESITNSRHVMRIIRPGLGRTTPKVGKFTYGLEKMNIPAVRQKFPKLDGTGVRVGILDTGIDPKHPDLVGKTVLYRDFSSLKSPVPSDEHGHGTHVAGTIAGGSASGTSIGVAPKASLIVGKIFEPTGGSTDENIIAAMQWMADPDGKPETNDFPQLVSNSWGDTGDFSTKDPQTDPFCMVTENWVRLGILPIFAAGNEGPGPGTVGNPGGCPMSMAVGATDENDGPASFSSRGPAKWKTATLQKPNVAAPGVATLSAKPGGGYQTMSGTSMATPHVAGLMTLLYQAKPDMTVDMAVKALIAGVTDLGTPGPDLIFGAGRADLLKSIEMMKTGALR